jgi:hypothetical protein
MSHYAAACATVQRLDEKKRPVSPPAVFMSLAR